jgi:tetratricopeptide (TPR) repeat protein
VALEKQAESFFAKASRIDPEYLLPIMNLGKLYYGQGEYRKAVASFEHYLGVRGEAEDVQGLYSSKTGDKKAGETQNSEAGLARELLGKSYLQLGDKAKAMEVWKKSLSMNPNQPELVSLMETSSDPAYKRNSLSIED